MRALIALVAMALPLMACDPVPAPPCCKQPPPPSDDVCGAAGVQAYIGRPVSDLPATGPWAALRVIRPGMMVTMDYSATRLNVQVDGSDRVLTLTCG